MPTSEALHRQLSQRAKLLPPLRMCAELRTGRSIQPHRSRRHVPQGIVRAVPFEAKFSDLLNIQVVSLGCVCTCRAAEEEISTCTVVSHVNLPWRRLPRRQPYTATCSISRKHSTATEVVAVPGQRAMALQRRWLCVVPILLVVTSSFYVKAAGSPALEHSSTANCQQRGKSDGPLRQKASLIHSQVWCACQKFLVHSALTVQVHVYRSIVWEILSAVETPARRTCCHTGE